MIEDLRVQLEIFGVPLLKPLFVVRGATRPGHHPLAGNLAGALEEENQRRLAKLHTTISPLIVTTT